MNIIAFDLGGSGGKLFLGKYSGNKLHIQTLHRFEHAALPINDNLYWDLPMIYQELLKGLSAAVEITNDTIDSLGIDSFCNDFALVSPGGELLTQMHSYRDPRTMRLSSEIYKIVPPEELYQINGNQIAPFNTLLQLGAMILQGQQYLLEKNTLLFLPDLLIYFLSGRKFTEYTLASVSQLYHYHKNDWSGYILKEYGISKSLFAKIVNPGTINCRTNEQINNTLHTKGFSITHVCEHDTASAFLASVCNGDYAIISCGTWALIGTETPGPIINKYGYKYNIANEGGYPGHHRILKNVMGTWIIQEVRADFKTHGIDYSFSEMENAAKEAKPFQFIIDVDSEIFYSPGHMIQKIQDYCKHYYNSIPSTLGEIIRCIYESLALKYRWNLECLQSLTGKSFETINIIGGGSQSELMCQFTANAVGKTVVAGPVEATALGNMIVQLAALKQISGIEEGRNIIRKSFPTFGYKAAERQLWNKQYEKFLSQVYKMQ